MTRWVRKEVLRYGGCPHCGSLRYGGSACPTTTCKACGTVQCMSNGGARGTCSICLLGILDGWSGHDRACGYKGCSERAVAEAPRIHNVCSQHALVAWYRTRRGDMPGETVAAFIASRLDEREKAWLEADEHGRHATMRAAELVEMREMLTRAGRDVALAERLAADGIGPFELEQRLIVPAGKPCSIEWTHGPVKKEEAA